MASILLLAPYSLWTPHFEIDLELALNSVNDGDTVTWIECRGELVVCDLNPDGKIGRCSRCISRRDLGISRTNLDLTRVTVGDLLEVSDREALAGLPTRFESFDDLRAFHFAGFDAGFAALSSTVWIARDSDLDLTVEPHITRLRGFLRSACAMYLATKRLLASDFFDRAYLFNGRMAPMRGGFRALREAGVETMIHERGCDLDHYSLSRNALPHEIAPMEARIRSAWNSSDKSEPERIQTALDWYDQRARGQSTNWLSFTQAQEQGRLPVSWDPEAHNIVIFTTSEYEFAAISDEWNNPLYESNAEAVMAVIEECRQDGGATVYVRMHPNLTGLKNLATQQLLTQAGENVEVIEPESDISTYSLASHASTIVVTGSSVGIEAAVRGGVVVLVGRCYYEGLGSVHVPNSRVELRDLLTDRNLEGKPPLGAYMYGFFMATFGVHSTHFQATGLFEGRFNGKELRPSRWTQSMRRAQLLAVRAIGLGQL